MLRLRLVATVGPGSRTLSCLFLTCLIVTVPSIKFKENLDPFTGEL